jgi:release factor glutamine methyltransferase
VSVTLDVALAGAARRIGMLDARALLAHVLGHDAAYLIAHGGEALAGDRHRAFEELVVRRAAGEPVAYLTGHREFYGLDFRVTPAVLIPRPETELLVELVLERLPPGAPARVLDLGTGSGCVAVCVARERPQARVVAVDMSRAALELAQENAATYGVLNIEFRLSNWFSRLADETFTVIAANPPYVAVGDPHLAQGDLPHEPAQALVAGADGLACLRAIADAAPAHLTSGGWLLLEHGHDQASQCREFLSHAGFTEVLSRPDLAGIERVTGGRLP